MGTLMLKSVVVLVSKQRGRVLPRKNYPYLNRWADPLFIGVSRGLQCSGDPVGLNSECPRRGRHASGNGHRVSLARRRRPAPGARAGARTGPMAVQGDIARTVRGHEHWQSTVVVREVLAASSRVRILDRFDLV
ncbi:hypothetical protein TIFTF001_037853 [Ficus carica]|uniref:Uncharacterized protein n=1 Tax=Ficus carica TaxID=3494 RepID=A0AA88EAJ1_FICCA|nr:hypothetical protein TIFTF001_037853 [Ficus carica]